MRHETLSGDPDIEQAITDLLSVAQDMRVRSSRLINLEERHREAAQREVTELYERIALRAARIGTTPAALVEILNAVLDVQARRGRSAPVGETSRTLLNAVTVAIAQEEDAHRALNAAQAAHMQATAHRVAVEQACEAFGLSRIQR